MGVTTDVINILMRVNGTSSYVNSMRQVTGSTDGFNNSAGKLISTLSRFVTAAAIVKFGKQCIEAASDLQEVANVTNVTFGQNAKIVDEWAKSQASGFGLSETAAKRYIGTYGTMAKQFGFTTDQATDMGIELTKLTGDVASFYNIEDKLASIKLKSVFTGETETLKELGVVMTEVNLNAYAMEKGFGKTLKQMTEHEKTALRYNFVMDKLSHAQGDFARTSDGWANSVRLLKLNFENLKIEIGNELLPVAGQGLSMVNSGLKTLSPVLVSIARTVRYYGEAWKNASQQTKGYVKAALGVVAVMAAAPRIIGIVSGAVRLLTMEITTLGGALNAVMGIAGLLLAGVAFKKLTEQVKEMKKTADTADTISNIGESADVSADAVDDLSEAMDSLGDSAEGLDTFLAGFDEVNKVGGSSSLMSNLVNTDDLANILGVADGLGDIQSRLSSLEAPQIDTPSIDFLEPEWWQKKWGAVKGFVSTFFNGDWKENWEQGLEIVGSLLEEHFPEWSAFWEKFGAMVAETFDVIGTKIDGLTQKIENTAWFRYFANAGSNAYDLLHENDGSGDETFMYTTKSGEKREALKYYADGSESELYKKYKHPEDYNSDGSLSFVGKHLHRYASGGIPNKGSLFIAGETGAELIGNFGGSQTKVINLSQTVQNTEQPILFQPTIMIDSRKITAAVIDGINGMTRSSGKSPLIELGG